VPKIMRQIFHWPMMGGIGLLIISTTIEMSVAAPVGLALYKKACKKYHGKLGEGKKSKADPSKFKYPPINQLSEENLGKAINKYREMWQRQTFNKTEKKMAKPSGKLSDEDIKALVAFINSKLKKNE